MRIRFIPLIIFGQLVLSAYLIHAKAQAELFCVVGKSCDAVQQSVYGQLWGIDVSTLGFIAFLLLGACYFLRARPLFHCFFLWGTGIGVVGALYFIGVQVFILKQLCSSCMFIDVGMLVLGYLVYRKHY